MNIIKDVFLCHITSWILVNRRRPNSQCGNPTCCLSYNVNTIPTDVLATDVTRASAGMVFNQISRKIPSLASEKLITRETPKATYKKSKVSNPHPVSGRCSVDVDNLSGSVVIAAPADGLASFDARESAGTVMTNFGSHILVDQHQKDHCGSD